MIDETQRSLLRNIAGTIGSLAVRCIKDPITVGSVSTFAMLLGALLENEDVDPDSFDVIHRVFSNFPHQETPELAQLFGGCLAVCGLVLHYDAEEATKLSGDLYTMWKRQQEASLN